MLFRNALLALLSMIMKMAPKVADGRVGLLEGGWWFR